VTDPAPARIRPARPDDLPKLCELEQTAGAPFRELGMDFVADDETWTVAELEPYQRDGRAWVIDDAAGEPVAYLLADVVDGNGHVEQVSVHPAHARQGLGRLLLETLDAWAREHRLPALTLTSYAEVPWNGPYYQRLGFRVLDDACLTPGLRRLREHEATRGLDRRRRVAMWRAVGRTMTDRELYDRGAATLLASWQAYAHGSTGAALRRGPGVATAVFPNGPEREIYNNALLDRDLDPTRRTAAIETMESIYRSADVSRYAAWVHESDEAMRTALTDRDYALDDSTRAMAMDLDRLPPAGSAVMVELGPPDWHEHLRIIGVAPALLSGADRRAFHVLVARLGGESAATALAFDHDGDCGIFNVTTLEAARRRGLGTALTARQLRAAAERGCSTASLQSSPIAERLYAAVGFRDLGRILEYVPGRAA
jgi:GNAT superfamily N-acetyltransferase